MTIGIYKLVFNGTNKIYVGQSLNIEKRLCAHMSLLRRGLHAKKLQDAYNTYGTPILEVILECEENELDVLEDIYLNKLNVVVSGFNTCRRAGGGSSLEGEDVSTSKYTNAQIEEAFLLLVNNPEKSSKEIHELTGVSKYMVDSISAFKSHKRLERLYPEEYAILKARDRSKSLAKNKTLKDIGSNYPPIVSPEGIEYIVENCSQFSKTHGLNNAHVIQVLKGKEKQHKGWKIKTNIQKEEPNVSRIEP